MSYSGKVMGGERRGEINTGVWCENLKERGHLEGLGQIFPNCAPRSTKCSAKHLQVLRKAIGKKNKINVTRSENCEFVRP